MRHPHRLLIAATLCAIAAHVAAQPPAALSRVVHEREATRPLAELTRTADPAWPVVQRWLAAVPNVEVLPVDQAAANESLLRLQVTLHSTMGAVAFHTGGILIDHGWLRLLGSGSPRMHRTLSSWSDGRVSVDAAGRPRLLLIADDVQGGLFAVNGGAFRAAPLGQVMYLAPDTLDWEGLSMGYTAFLQWALSPKMHEFYQPEQWPHWENDVSQLTPDQSILFQPFLWATGPEMRKRGRKIVPVDEMTRLMFDLERLKPRNP